MLQSKCGGVKQTCLSTWEPFVCFTPVQMEKYTVLLLIFITEGAANLFRSNTAVESSLQYTSSVLCSPSLYLTVK